MAALLAGLLLGPARAGDWHRGAAIVCSDCHTIHNSEGGQPMRYDGSLPEAPDVVAPVTYLADPAGGFFAEDPLGQPSPNGHDLLPASPTPAPGGSDSMALSCSSCHDPHGSPSYRNLVEEPAGSGNAGPAPVLVNQQVVANGSNPEAVYTPDNLRYKSGMSAWCNDCHGDFHGRTGGEEGTNEPWLRHPQSRALSGSYGADYGHWSGTLTNRVPVETPDDDLIPSTDDAVFCLSCHKAHGSAHPDALIHADGSTRLSTCQQCHNQ